MQKVKKWFTKLKVICLVCVAVFIALFALVGVMGRATNKIVITGDAEVMEYIETLAYYYTNYVNTDISIDVNAPGSSQAVKDVSEGIADYGIIARNLTTSEENLDGIVSTDTVLAEEAFVLIVNNDFPTDLVGQMSILTAGSIFYSDTPTWRDREDSRNNFVQDDRNGIWPDDSDELRDQRNEVFGDMSVIPVHRIKGDGLRESFEEIGGFEAALVGNESGKNIDNYADMDTRGVIKESDGEIVEYVKQNLGAVGYVRYSTYNANRGEVKMLPITNSSDYTIRELTEQNFQSTSAEMSYPLVRGIKYFYNEKYVSEEAREFINWITTGFTNEEFEDYLDDGVVTYANGEVNAGTVPLQVGLIDSIVPDYRGYRRRRVETVLGPALDAAIAQFPYNNEFDAENQAIRIEVSDDLTLPSSLGDAVITYTSTDYNVLDPSEGGVIHRPAQDQMLNLTVTFTVGVRKDGETQITNNSLFVTQTKTVYLLIKGTEA